MSSSAGEDSRGAARKTKRNAPRRCAWKCKGASGKTSGRSIFPNAPLRATSSGLKSCMSDAIAKALPTHVERTWSRVGFAWDRKLLRWFANLSFWRGGKTRIQRGICSNQARGSPIVVRIGRCVSLRSSCAKLICFLYNSKTHNSATMRP